MMYVSTAVPLSKPLYPFRAVYWVKLYLLNTDVTDYTSSLFPYENCAYIHADRSTILFILIRMDLIYFTQINLKELLCFFFIVHFVIFFQDFS